MSADAAESEEEMFRSVLASMGMAPDSYDPALPEAMSMYSRRFASELMCDAKDYSEHAARADIEVDDVKLAANLTASRVLALDPRQSIANRIAADVNMKDLVQIMDKESALHKLPKQLYENLLQRNFTYVPGSEAYRETEGTNDGSSSSSSVGNSGFQGLSLQRVESKEKRKYLATVPTFSE